MDKLYVYVLIFIILSCSSLKKENNKITYSNTDGLSLLFKLENQKNGKLFINNKDSISFNYDFKKTYIKLIDSKTKKEKKTLTYQYYIDFSDNNVKKYKILKEYDTIVFLKKRTLFRFESHLKW